MASLSEAYKGMSPYQPTQVVSYTTQQLLQMGYQEVSKLGSKEQNLVSELRDTLEKIKSFWWERFQLIGIDAQGKIPPFFVHFQSNNAYYHPPVPNQVPEHFAFNDQYVHSPEVVAHEFTHGVINWLNPLGNTGEAGAINESIADVVGIVFKRNMIDRYGHRIYMDWKINNFRDLSISITKENFNHDLTPKFDLEGRTTNDNGHVHDNSRILSHAFYLAAIELAKDDQGNQQLLEIWITAVRLLKADEKNFKGFSNKTIEISFKKSGAPFQEAIKRAWKTVGVQNT